jgi:hypothetical protein
MEANKLRKLAEAIRAYAEVSEQTKQQKLANLVVASTGLELLRRKIQG